MFHGYFVDFYYYDHGPWNPHTTLKVEFIQAGQGTSRLLKKSLSNGSVTKLGFEVLEDQKKM